MFSYVDYLEVIKYEYKRVPNTDQISQTLLLKIPRTKTKFFVHVANRIRLPDLKKGDKVRVILDFYNAGRGLDLRWTIRDVILINDLPSFEINQEESEPPFNVKK